jgi:hypothetical protein
MATPECVPLSHVTGALLVAYENVTDRGVEDWVVDGQNGPTGQAEDGVDPFSFKALY